MDVSYKLFDDLTLHIALLRDVKNAAELKQRLLSGSLSCALIRPAYIVHPDQVAVAAGKASLSQHHKKLTTKNIYTELLFNLSLSKNITQSLIKFGIDNTDTDVIAVVIGSQDEFTQVLAQIDGTRIDLGELSKFTNEEVIMECYSVNKSELSVSSLAGSVITRIATKSC